MTSRLFIGELDIMCLEDLKRRRSELVSRAKKASREADECWYMANEIARELRKRSKAVDPKY